MQVFLASALSLLVGWVGWSIHQLETASELRAESILKLVDNLDRRLTVIEQNGAASVRERLAVLEALVKQNQTILMELRDRQD